LDLIIKHGIRIQKKGKDGIMRLKNYSDLPQGCPPSGVVSKDIEPVYRFIENDFPQEIDFLNHIERNKPFPPNKTCEAFALSFFTSIEAAEKAKKKFKSLRNKKVIKGKITSQCGVYNIENEHLNLWLYEGVNMLKIFTGEEEKGENK
jgi:hypothetical protein